MFGFFILFGGCTVLSLIAVADDALQSKKQQQFFRLFNEKYQSFMGFIVSLLGTKPKDWVLDNGLRLKEPFLAHLELIYQEEMLKQGDRTLQVVWKARLMIEFQWHPDEADIKVRNLLQMLPPLAPQEQVKVERVLAHLHALYTGFVRRETEKVVQDKEREEERANQYNVRLQQEVLVFLEKETQWEQHIDALSWGRETDACSVTITLYKANKAQYICLYDKPNKELQSKVLRTEYEQALKPLQPTLDAWCVTQIQKWRS